MALLPMTEKGDNSPLLQKQKCQNRMQNYRGITLLSIPEKVSRSREGSLYSAHTVFSRAKQHLHSGRSVDGNRVDLLLADPL